ncbi:MAG: isochorismatase family protein [Acidimicrobiales bacterium]
MAPSSAFAQGFAGQLTPGERPALIVIDMMRSYFEEGSPFCLPSADAVHSASRLLDDARDHSVPVIHTRVVFGPDGLDGGHFITKVPALRLLIGENHYNEFMDEVAPLGHELVVTKQYASAFSGTSLSATLTFLGVDTLVIVGVSTSGCVRATAMDALQHGLIPLVVSDAVGDRDLGVHEANLYDLQAKYAEVINEPTARSYLAERP